MPFFAATDGGGDGVQCGAEAGDFGAEARQGVGLPAAGAVLFDGDAEVGIAVEGCAPEPGAAGDLIEGDRPRGENNCCAGTVLLLGVFASLGARVSNTLAGVFG